MDRFSKRVASRNELKSPLFWRDVLCEFLSTAILLIYITYSVVNYKEGFETTPTHVGIALGCIVYMLVDTFGQFGGGQMNPAVTLVFVIRGDMTVVKGCIYLLTQCLGAGAGSGIVYAIVAPEYRDVFHAVKPAEELGPWRAVAVEIIITAMLCFIALAVTDPHRTTPYPMPGLPIGLTVTAGILTAGMSTGGALNPVAMFGPAVIARDFGQHWVYWVGPMLGAVVSALIYFPFSYMQRHYTPHSDDAEEIETIDVKDGEDDGEKMVLKVHVDS